jgi:phage-related protein
MAVFSYIPDRGFGTQTSPRVLNHQFGDGYSQRTADGINVNNVSWNLTFNNRTIADITAIVSFLEDKAGSTIFQWTPPGDTTQYNVLCADWVQTYDSYISRSLSAKFTKVNQIV